MPQGIPARHIAGWMFYVGIEVAWQNVSCFLAANGSHLTLACEMAVHHNPGLAGSQEVSATLLHIGVPHLVEYVTPDGLFSIDIALRNGNQVLPSHCSMLPVALAWCCCPGHAAACGYL